MKMKRSLVRRAAQALEAGNMENLGFCIYCNHEQGGCEPDLRKGHCENCGKPGVYGAEQILIEGA